MYLSKKRAFSLFETEDGLLRYLSAERRLCDIVRKGDHAAFSDWKREFNACFPEQGPSPSLRTAQYFYISLLTLICDAAVRGGLSPEQVVVSCRKFMDRFRLTADPRDIPALAAETAGEFVRRVCALRRGGEPSLLEKKVYRYIMEHISEPIRTEEIARYLFISRGHLSTRFKRETGVALSDYIRARRLDEARRLLQRPGLGVTEISRLLGFCSPSHFTTTFKKDTGMTPQQWRVEYC